MLTVAPDEIDPTTQYWILEYCLEMGKSGLIHSGPGEVTYYPHNKSVESAQTGFSNEYYVVLSDELEVWGDDEYYMAIFADEESMRTGAKVIVQAYGNEMPMGLYQQLSSL